MSVCGPGPLTIKLIVMSDRIERASMQMAHSESPLASSHNSNDEGKWNCYS